MIKNCFRIKSVEFKARSFTLDLPKQLLLANVAIRLMITQYDHLSPVCCLYGLGIQKKKKVTAVEKQPEETQAVGDENERAISSSDVAESSDDRQPTTDTAAEMTVSNICTVMLFLPRMILAMVMV